MKLIYAKRRYTVQIPCKIVVIKILFLYNLQSINRFYVIIIKINVV